MDDQDSESPQLQKLELTLDPENLKDKTQELDAHEQQNYSLKEQRVQAYRNQTCTYAQQSHLLRQAKLLQKGLKQQIRKIQ